MSLLSAEECYHSGRGGKREDRVWSGKYCDKSKRVREQESDSKEIQRKRSFKREFRGFSEGEMDVGKK